MDAKSFDRMAKAIGIGSRRRLLAGIGPSLTGLALWLAPESAAKKKGRKGNKGKKKKSTRPRSDCSPPCGDCELCVNGVCGAVCGPCETCRLNPFIECISLCDPMSCQWCDPASGSCVSICDDCELCIDGTCQPACGPCETCRLNPSIECVSTCEANEVCCNDNCEPACTNGCEPDPTQACLCEKAPGGKTYCANQRRCVPSCGSGGTLNPTTCECTCGSCPPGFVCGRDSVGRVACMPDCGGGWCMSPKFCWTGHGVCCNGNNWEGFINCEAPQPPIH